MIDFLYNELPLFLYFFLLFFLIKKNPFIFVIFFYLFFQQIKNVLSNYYVNINAPVYMREVESYSVNDASLLLLVFLYSAAFVSIYIFYNYIFKKKLESLIFQFEKINNSAIFIRFFFYITFIIILVLIGHILASNTPLFHENINKNNYWTDYALVPKIKFLSSQLNTLLFINGFFYAKSNLFHKKKYIPNKLYITMLILTIFYYILMKQKFGGPLLMLFSFYLPYLTIGLLSRKLNFFKLVKYSFGSIGILSGTVYGYFYMRFGNDAGKMILERVLSLQSEIWELTYQYLVNGLLPFEHNEFINELLILFGFNQGYTGMQYVMSKVMESDYFNFFIDIHINLSSAYPSYLFYIFEDSFIEFPLIILVNFLIYSLYIILGFKVLEKLLSNRILIASIYLKLFFSIEALWGQVYLDSVFTFKEILFICLIILLESNFFKKKIRRVYIEKHSIY